MTRPPEARHHLHPATTWQRRRYLLRHWRHREARERLLRNLLGWARPVVQLWRERRTRAWRPAHLSMPALLSQLHPGDLLLEAGGAELFWLEQMLAGSARPAVVYHSDLRVTSQYNYHPVETVWLLEQAGYRVQVLTSNGPVARPEGWHAHFPDPMPGAWLLATPPAHQEPAP